MDNIDLGSIGNKGAAPNVEPAQRKVQKESPPPPPPQEDKVEISSEGKEAAAYVKDVKEMSPMRPAVVEEMKAKVKGGNYPPPALIDGMVRLMGHSLKVSSDK